MKLLLDMNMSPEWSSLFHSAGFDCVHWATVGDISADDKELFNWAAENGYVILTHDLDFGAILAATNANSPSVVILRSQLLLPDSPNAHNLVRYVEKYSKELEMGALIAIDEDRARVRILPMKKN